MKGIKMSVKEFKAWLDGYTQAKKELTKDDIELIRQKLSEVYEEVQYIPNPYPVYPPYWVEPVSPYWEKPGYIPTITRPDTAGNVTWTKEDPTTGDFILPLYGPGSTCVRGGN